MCLLDQSQAMEEEGIKINAIQAGTFKLAGSSFQPLTEEERQMFQDDIDHWYKLFTEDVLKKRNLKSEYMQGQTYDGAKAVELGLADGLIDSIDDLLAMTLEPR